MQSPSMQNNRAAKIVYCHCAFAQVIPADVKQGVLERLVASGVDFDGVPDLCEMSARRDPALARLAQSPGVRIAACYPRAVQGLFTAAGSPLPKVGAEIVNMRTATAADAFALLTQPDGVETAEGEK
ncbi:MAG TPA: hypothetical protein VF278_23510 [Pirellulales bacterium]